jgi:hypothetical protein
MVVQWWIFDLFDLACWGLQNANEHGVDLETQQRMIHLAKCEHVIHYIILASHFLITKGIPFVTR